MKNILTIGESMGLFVADTPGLAAQVTSFTRYSAGAEMNVAIGLSRLGLNSYYVTRLGVEPLGQYIQHVLERENIKTDYVTTTDQQNTGFMMKEKALEGADPKVYYYRKNSAVSKMTVSDININFDKIDHVHLSGVYPAISSEAVEVTYFIANEAKKRGIPITFDPNLRPTLWPSREAMVAEMNKIAALADYVLPGIAEGEILMGSNDPSTIADFYLNAGAKAVIIKLAEKGAYVKDKNGEQYVTGYKVENIVDTVGAGDGFATGVISGIVTGLPIEEAVKRGNAIGAIQLTSPSDNEGLPTLAQLNEFMGR